MIQIREKKKVVSFVLESKVWKDFIFGTKILNKYHPKAKKQLFIGQFAHCFSKQIKHNKCWTILTLFNH